MKNVVIYHRADFDGLFCRAIAQKFLPDAELIGWDYGDPIPDIINIGGPDCILYMLDISVEGLMDYPNLVWIDHHKSAIEKYRPTIFGYRIDGVAACRLAWQFFADKDRSEYMNRAWTGGSKDNFVNRMVNEPEAVRLAGEYDVWDKRDPDADTFQFGLRSRPLTDADWEDMLQMVRQSKVVIELVKTGKLLQQYQQKTDSDIVTFRSFFLEWEGLKFIALNTARCNSNTFMVKDVPETSHDALMGFYWDGARWTVSLYHAKHRTDLDLSPIAVKWGGGGHRGACGFKSKTLPFMA